MLIRESVNWRVDGGLDLVIVAGMQRIEHYDIAAHGTDIALAKALGEREVVDPLCRR
jgi:ferritin-like metal-binding protein YciE